MRRTVAAGVLALLAAPAGAEPAAASLGGAPAPSWEGVTWLAHAPAAGLAPGDFRGRVLVVACFGSGASADPAALAEAWRPYEGSPDVALVALHSAPPGAAFAAAEAEGRALLVRLGLPVPLGVLAGAVETPARRYAAAALPRATLVDRAGVVRFEGPATDASRLASWIETLRAARGAAHPMVGRPLGSIDGLRWLTPEGAPVALAGQRLTLFRWWTNACPHCTGSVPSLARLESRFRARGLRFVAVYHPKGRRLGDAQAREHARQLGFEGALAFDDRWTKYLELRDRGGLRKATSISVLVDSDGLIRWVHPGPRLQDHGHPQTDGAADFAELERLLGRLLPAAAGSPAPRR